MSDVGPCDHTADGVLPDLLLDENGGERGGQMLSLARRLVVVTRLLRPDRGPLATMTPWEDLAADDWISNSLCQFDVLWCVLARALGHGSSGTRFYPSCAALHQYRTQPVERAALMAGTYLVQEYTEQAARSSTLVVDDAVAMLEGLGTPPGTDLGEIVDSYQLLAAGLIWARLLGVVGRRAERLQAQDAETRFTRFAADPPPWSRSREPFTLEPPLDKHRQYLILRFGQVAERWARVAARNDTRWAGPVLPGKYPTPPGETPELMSYLEVGAAPEVEPSVMERLLSSGAVKPGDLRLDLVLQFLEQVAHEADAHGVLTGLRSVGDTPSGR